MRLPVSTGWLRGATEVAVRSALRTLLALIVLRSRITPGVRLVAVPEVVLRRLLLRAVSSALRTVLPGVVPRELVSGARSELLRLVSGSALRSEVSAALRVVLVREVDGAEVLEGARLVERARLPLSGSALRRVGTPLGVVVEGAR